MAGPAATDSARAAGCATGGVSVVVDAGAAGGISTRCAAGDPGSGLAALSAAGHAYTFVPRQPGFVCTLDRRPDPCNGAPASAYWSYWHARPGGSWTYSTLGAGSFDPPPGSVEGWAFGSGAPPGVRPPAAAAPRPTPSRTTPSRTTPPRPAPSRTTPPTTPSPPRTTAPRSTPSRTSASPSPTSTAASSTPKPATTTSTTRPPAVVPPTRSASATPTPSTPSTTPTSTTPSSPSSPSTIAATTVADPVSGSGGLTGPALVAALVLALGGGAALVTRRRRSP